MAQSFDPRVRRRVVSLALGIVTVGSLAGCAFGSGGADEPTPFVTVSPSSHLPSQKPSPSASPVDPNALPPDSAGAPQMWPRVEPVGAISAQDAMTGWVFAADTAKRFAYAAPLWHPDVPEAGTVDGAYLFPSGFMTDAASEDYQKRLFADNPVAGSPTVAGELLWAPPKVDGRWVFPAVDRFMWGQPTLSDVTTEAGLGVPVMRVEFPLYGQGVYTRDARFFLVNLSRKVTFDIALTSKGWMLADWKSSALTYDTAVPLEEIPNGRRDAAP